MNNFEKQLRLQQTLAELGMSTMVKLAELQSEGTRKYLERNQEFARRISDLSDASDWAELQRDYAETVWKDFQETLQAQSDAVQQAIEDSSGLIRDAFASTQ